MRIFIFTMLIFYVSFFSQKVLSKSEVENLKDIDLTSDDYWFLNPAHGAAWWEGGILENFYDYADGDDKAIGQIIEKLFFRKSNFETSKTEKSLFNTVLDTDEKIGKFLGFLASKKLSTLEEKRNEIIVKYKETYDDVIEINWDNGTAKGTKQRKAKNLQLGKEPKIIEEIMNDYLENLQKDLNLNLKGKKRKDDRNVLKQIITLSQTDTRVYFVFLGALWFRADMSKDSFLEYYKGVHSQTGNTAFNEKGKEILTSPDGSSEAAREWKSLKFTELSTDPPTEDQYEELLFWLVRRKSNGMPLSSHPGDLHLSSNRNQGYGDCGEIATRHFIKLIIDNGGKGDSHYNTEILEAMGTDPNIIQFFEDYPTRIDQSKDQARRAWGLLLSDREKVVYTHQIKLDDGKDIWVELDTGAKNVLELTKQLLLSQDKRASINDWVELGREIEEVRVQVLDEGAGAFNIEAGPMIPFKNEKGEDDLTGNITISANSAQYEWSFRPLHSEFEEKASTAVSTVGDMPGWVNDINARELTKKAESEQIKRSHIYPFYEPSIHNAKEKGLSMYTPIDTDIKIKQHYALMDIKSKDCEQNLDYFDNSLARMNTDFNKTNLIEEVLNKLIKDNRQICFEITLKILQNNTNLVDTLVVKPFDPLGQLQLPEGTSAEDISKYYLEKISENFINLRNIDLYNIASSENLSLLQKFIELHSLTVVVSKEFDEDYMPQDPKNRIEDLSFLDQESFKKLKKLNINHRSTNSDNSLPYMGYSDISTISRMLQLEELSLNSDSLEDLRPISELKKLKFLSLAGEKIKDLGPLSSLEKLQELTIVNTSIESLDPIVGLSNLKKITTSQDLIAKFEEDFNSKRGELEAVTFILNKE
jgi:hypothetical protein